MVRSLWTAASGMIAQQENVDTIAHNLANLNTTGYKTEVAEFKSLLYQTIQTRSTNNAGEEKPVGAQVGLGSRTAAITSMFTEGNLNPSESPFAAAIEGDGFFKVRTESGEIQYTRDGNFAASPVANGTLLCTSEGHPVLDQYNNMIIIPQGINATTISYAKDGTVSVSANGSDRINLVQRDANGNPLYTVQLGIVQFNNPAGLVKASGNRYRQSVASGNPMEESQTQGIRRSTIHHKYIEASNVQVADEMVNLIVAQRAYQMNSKVIQASDEMLEQANNLRR
ncbi:MAG: flagellar hook-basal body protein [Lachnospiraceae bacterium]|nr:flagellar hook-basal body protein [Lachnospiraceae bacterium]